MEISLFGSHPGRPGLDLPHPSQSGLTVAAIGLVPLIAGMTELIRPISGLVFAGIFVAAGALRAWFAYHELVGLRRLADCELRRRRPHLSSGLAAWRSDELTSGRHRTALARAVARTERDLSPTKLPGASPLNRVAVRPHADLLRRLAERLAARDRPVTARGVLQVEDLLTSPDSPLYERERAQELRPSMLACLEALDGVSEDLSEARRNGLATRGYGLATRGHRGDRS